MKKIILVILALVALYFMPFIIVENNGVKVPFLSMNLNKGEEEITFDNIRSAYAISKDMMNAADSYEAESCYGDIVYVNEEEDFTIMDWSVEAGFPFNKGTYKIKKGNYCKGWNNDLAITYEKTLIENIDEEYYDQQAEKDECVFIKDGKIKNDSLVYGFINSSRLGIMDMVRFISKDNGLEVMDIQYMENDTFEITTLKDGKIEKSKAKKLTFNEDENGLIADGKELISWKK